ncbi:hypothetical protein RRG08_024230 [Elysia crispata]|uniref:Uncharacterized protein n=1 Tax=Elysia crispata TaxID=231223 RepID=A0AAE1D3I4_9GAST|nr:hypothetical protein RRG08_024230 [Elysia crispata]
MKLQSLRQSNQEAGIYQFQPQTLNSRAKNQPQNPLHDSPVIYPLLLTPALDPQLKSKESTPKPASRQSSDLPSTPHSSTRPSTQEQRINPKPASRQSSGLPTASSEGGSFCVFFYTIMIEDVRTLLLAKAKK